MTPHEDTETGACFAYASALCAKAYECSGIGSFDSYLHTSCKIAGPTCPDVVFGPGSTRTIEGLYACAEAYRDFSCDDYALGLLPDCVTPGTRLPGEPCFGNAQCASLSCDGEGSCGTCDAVATPTDDCSQDGFICPFGESCVGTLCEPNVPGDATCEIIGCPSGQFCSGAVCHDYLEEGDPCVSSQECAAGYCDNETGLCALYPTLGMSCEEPRTCVMGSYCELDGLTCEAQPGMGEPCGVDGWTGEPAHCGEGLRCNLEATPMPVCATAPPPLGPGDACGTEVNNYCDYNEGLTCQCQDPECVTAFCGRTLDLGETCNVSTPWLVCREGTQCTDGTCQSFGDQGLADACEAP